MIKLFLYAVYTVLKIRIWWQCETCTPCDNCQVERIYAGGNNAQKWVILCNYKCIVYHSKETCKFFPDLVLLVSSEVYAGSKIVY